MKKIRSDENVIEYLVIVAINTWILIQTQSKRTVFDKRKLYNNQNLFINLSIVNKASLGNRDLHNALITCKKFYLRQWSEFYFNTRGG